MTQISFEQLMLFFNSFAESIGKGVKVADFGGTDGVGTKLIKDALASGGITNYITLDHEHGVDLLKLDDYLKFCKDGKFGVGFCMDVLEHTSQPFVVAENICLSLKPGALLFVTVPFTWELHYYPKDYWRFTPQGLEELFKDYMDVLHISLVRDLLKGEEVERSRVAGVFRRKIIK